jgi:predicted nucleic acid-binding protein
METESKAKEPFLIADSSGLISLTSHTDRNYSHALKAAQQLEETQATILVPYDVYAETINMVGKKQGHAKAYEVGQVLSKTAPFLIIDSSPHAREQALSRLLTLSQSVSYTDAVVMAVADEYQTQKIFGFDEAFANCGYENPPMVRGRGRVSLSCPHRTTRNGRRIVGLLLAILVGKSTVNALLHLHGWYSRIEQVLANA